MKKRITIPKVFPIPHWVLALCILGLAIVLMLLALYSNGTLRYWTGEEELLPQLRGVFQLTADRTRKQPTNDLYTPVTNADVNPYGINTFLEQEVEPAKREQSLAMIAAAGFHWVRQEFPWEDIEIHDKGDFEDRRNQPYRSAWDKYDNIVSLSEQYNLQLIVRLGHPPAWTRAKGNTAGSYGPPDNYDDFGDYVEAVVSRYKGRIHYYQIWNEPNIYPEWGEQPVSPEDYTRLLKIAYTRAKAVGPDVVIIAGALAATIENDLYPHGMNDFIYLQRMYDAGAAPYFDVLSMQGYGLWSGPYDRRMRPRVLDFSRPLYLRELMVKNGDAEKSIWISELNWNAIPLESSAYPAYGRVSLEQQAEYVTMAYRRAQQEWPWLGVVNFWFFKRASDVEKDQPMYYFRMVDPDFTPMPVYQAMQALTAEQPVLGLGLHQESDWALTYRGDWQSEEDKEAQLSYIRASSDGSISLNWRGTNLFIRAAGPATVAVSFDGETAQTYAVPDGLSGIEIASSTKDRVHTTEISVKSGNIKIDSFSIYRRDIWLRPILAVLVAVATGLAGLSLGKRNNTPG